MTDSNTIKIEELKQKIQRVLSMYEVLKEEKNELLKEKINLSKLLEDQSNRVNEIERKYKDLQVAKAVTSGDGSSDVAKKKIDGLVREIDKCIAILAK